MQLASSAREDIINIPHVLRELYSKNSLDICDFDYVTRFELFLAALNRDIIHLDLYLVL